MSQKKGRDMPKPKILVDGMTREQLTEKIYSIAIKSNYTVRTDISIQKSNPDNWPEMDQADFDFLANVMIPRHGSAQIKIGSGIKKITFGVNSRCQYPKLKRPPCCMYAMRTDGTVTDISWKECINPNSHRDKVLSAMRNTVKHQIKEYRESVDLFWTCQICEGTFSDDGFEVDHHPISFLEMVETWMKENDLNFEDIQASGENDFEQGDHFIDKALETKWADRHKEFSLNNLRPVCCECHRGKKKGRKSL